jgi:hypothetical protein
MKRTMNTRTLQNLGGVAFFVGVIIAFVLSIIAIWNNIESTSYYFSGVKYPPFSGLRCPVMIGPTETGMVNAVFDNPTDKEDNFFYRAEISGRSSSTRQVEGQIAVPPRETRSVQLTVDSNDVDLMFFILVKMSILPNALHKSQEAVCGTMLVNILGLTGVQIATIALILSFLGMAVGLGIWHQTNNKSDSEVPRVVQALGFVVIVALFAASMGWWTPAIVLCVIAILLMVISLRFAIA